MVRVCNIYHVKSVQMHMRVCATVLYAGIGRVIIIERLGVHIHMWYESTLLTYTSSIVSCYTFHFYESVTISHTVFVYPLHLVLCVYVPASFDL